MTIPDQIHMVTGNPAKFKSAIDYAGMAGLSPDIFTHTPLEITEIQADAVADVALDKARKAFDQLRAPVMVNDGALQIPALGGFPGVYSEYILRKIGCDGILKLMDGRTGADRSAHFVSTVVYIDDTGQEYLFHGSTHDGHIAHDIRPVHQDPMWNVVWRIFIPDAVAGDDALSELSNDQMDRFQAESTRVSALFEAMSAIATDQLEKAA